MSKISLKLKNWIAKNIWPFCVYQQRLNNLNDILFDKQHTIDNLEKLLDSYLNRLENFNLLTEHIARLEIEKESLSRKYLELDAEKKLLENEFQNFKEEQLQKHKLRISSIQFWDEHYKNNGNSGTGSYNRLAEFKADIINNFINNNTINSAIEFGCGDGHQLSLINYNNYTCVDVSEFIIQKNKEFFKSDSSKEFYCILTERDKYINKQFELSLSLDVIFHLIEDINFENYMEDLFRVSSKYVIIYSSNHEEYTIWPEYRHRKFMKYIQEHIHGWELYQFIPNKYPYVIGEEENTSTADFYIFKKIGIDKK